jgi:hypothetical protein
MPRIKTSPPVGPAFLPQDACLGYSAGLPHAWAVVVPTGPAAFGVAFLLLLVSLLMGSCTLPVAIFTTSDVLGSAPLSGPGTETSLAASSSPVPLSDIPSSANCAPSVPMSAPRFLLQALLMPSSCLNACE